MQWVKVPLVLGAVVTFLALLRHRERAGLRAGGRVASVVLLVAAIAAIVNPDLTQVVAQWLGVSRGADLLLYTLVVVFAISAIGLYVRQREGEHQLRRLARALALERALAEAPPRATGPGAPGDALRAPADPA